ncbi:MAG: hypothetical protein IIX77_06115, partial [Oscillospiraceae bacterium]|nr:hypothetical protein [Oscillospiraceae bacterium]
MEDKNLTPENVEQEENVSFWNKTKAKLVQLTDQNSDGSFDKEDVAVIATAISNMAKSTATAIKT